MSKGKLFLLFLGDVIVLYFSLWLTLVLRYQRMVSAELWQKHLLPFTIIFVVWLIIFFINRLYDLSLMRNNYSFLGLLAKSLSAAGIVGFVFFYFATTGISPKTVLVLELIIFGALFLSWRRIFNRLLTAEKFLETAVLVGLSEETWSLFREINGKPQMGFRVVGIIQPDGLLNLKFKSTEIKIINDLNGVQDFLQNNKVKLVIVSEEARNYGKLINELYIALAHGLTMVDLPTFIEKFAGKIMINTIGQMWFLENIKEKNKRVFELSKRLMDITISAMLLIIALPFLPLIYLIIRLTSKGPGFFMQQRTGRLGKKFMAVKFRTMYENAEVHGPQWATKDDPRVTPMGRFFRKIRIDEVPQLINVLRGEMSFIGPRPERPEFIEKLKETIPFYETRLLVKPGITGWAQVNFPYGASEEDAQEKLQYDLYYIKNRSVVLDASILLKTIKTVLSGGGR